MASMACCAASTPASSVKWSSRVAVDQPEPLASCASTIDVTKAVISVDSSVCTSGMAVEATATRSWRIMASPPTMRASAGSASSRPASSASRDEATKVRRAPCTIVQPASTRLVSETAIRCGSW